MTYAILPLTEDPWQVFTLDLTIDDEPFHAQIEIRYLSAPDQWVLSIWDHAAGELLVNQTYLRKMFKDEMNMTLQEYMV